MAKKKTAKPTAAKKSSGAKAQTSYACERDERGRMWHTTPMSGLERKFLDLWQEACGPDLERETAFDLEVGGVRKWRSDFTHRASGTLFEIEGGAWSGGRHTRGAGFEEDCDKYLRAWHLGWNVVRLSGKQLTPSAVAGIIRRIRGGQDAGLAQTGPHLHGLPLPASDNGVGKVVIAESVPDAPGWLKRA